VEPIHVEEGDDDDRARQQHDLAVLVDVKVLLQRRHVGCLQEERAAVSARGTSEGAISGSKKYNHKKIRLGEYKTGIAAKRP
jgi:hypothetical protein